MSFLQIPGSVQTLSAEPPLPLDGQGKPSYGEAFEFDARVSPSAGTGGDGGEVYLTQLDGTRRLVSLVLYLDAGEPQVPTLASRITLDGLTHIVIEKIARCRISGELRHTRLRCRSERNG